MSFEERLLSQLKEVVAERPEPHGTPARARVARWPRLALAGAAAAALAVGAVVVTGGDGASPAYAVAKQSDGSVTVEIRDLRDAAGLEQKLRDAGIAAKVDYVPEGKACKEPRFRQPGPDRRFSMTMGQRQDGSAFFTIRPGQLRDGETLVISNTVIAPTGGAGSGTAVGTAVADGPVAPCELVDAPRGSEIPPPGKAGPDAGLERSDPSADGEAKTHVERLDP